MFYSVNIFIPVDLLNDGGKKTQRCIGVPSGEVIDFIIRGFLLMLRLRNNGLANKQLYEPYIKK